ncbi:hypothetical protein NGM99_12620 [Mesorhizobium sp. RP14(2022)]|uniref:Uncharacterized protein n=1 Tax=Mesorhizobium liriopis TaxID=2953882 RepID=A0ABT1C713_9HYPH|nr:hypothetical protein [Mesorhizobium liriopis]MCO6050627.1 hypothetical protein [Mesorhizobium liriopis]
MTDEPHFVDADRFDEALSEAHEGVVALMLHTLALPEEADRVPHIVKQIDLYSALSKALNEIAETVTGVDLSECQAIFDKQAQGMKAQALLSMGEPSTVAH